MGVGLKMCGSAMHGNGLCEVECTPTDALLARLHASLLRQAFRVWRGAHQRRLAKKRTMKRIHAMHMDWEENDALAARNLAQGMSKMNWIRQGLGLRALHKS